LEVLGFINCIHTYIAILLQEKIKTDDYLLFLTDKKLITQSIHDQKVNPWITQPVYIGQADSFEKNMFSEYIDFLRTHFGFYVYCFDKKKLIANDLLKLFMEFNEYKFIIPVDEYYIVGSKYYKKMHNPHTLLVKEVFRESIICFDIENRKLLNINKEMILKSVFSNYAAQKIIVCDDRNVLIKQEILYRTRQKKNVGNKIDFQELILSCNNLESQKQRYESIRLSLIFQIEPFINMLKMCITEENNIAKSTTRDDLKMLTKMIIKGNICGKYNEKKITEKFHKIINTYNDLLDIDNNMIRQKDMYKVKT
jgi:hypothetical protein